MSERVYTSSTKISIDCVPEASPKSSASAVTRGRKGAGGFDGHTQCCSRGLLHILQVVSCYWDGSSCTLDRQTSIGVGIMKNSERLTVVIKLGAGNLPRIHCCSV